MADRELVHVHHRIRLNLARHSLTLPNQCCRVDRAAAALVRIRRDVSGILSVWLT
jgi:hypothetical protein